MSTLKAMQQRKRAFAYPFLLRLDENACLSKREALGGAELPYRQ